MTNIEKLLGEIERALDHPDTFKRIVDIERRLHAEPSDFATASRVERVAEELAKLRERVDNAKNTYAHGYVVEDLAELRERVDNAKNTYAHGYVVEDLIKMVEDTGARLAAHAARIEQLEDAIGWRDGKNMENATEPNLPANDFLVITYEWQSPDKAKPTECLQIEVLTAKNKRDFYFSPDDIDFSPTAFDPVIAWRYSERT